MLIGFQIKLHSILWFISHITWNRHERSHSILFYLACFFVIYIRIEALFIPLVAPFYSSVSWFYTIMYMYMGCQQTRFLFFTLSSWMRNIVKIRCDRGVDKYNTTAIKKINTHPFLYGYNIGYLFGHWLSISLV